MTDYELVGHKKEYNKWLKRHFAAELYLDNNNIPMAERERWLPEYHLIMDNLNYILSLFEADGIKYTWEEGYKGFDV